MRTRALPAALLAIAAILRAGEAAGAARAAGAEGYRIRPSAGGTFVMRYPPRLEPMAREIESLLERAAADIAGELGLETIASITVYLAGDDGTYRDAHEGHVPEWSAAFGDVREQVIGIHAPTAAAGPRRLHAVVRHELSHLLFAQRVGGTAAPSWFMEGLAMIQSGEWRFADEWNFMLLAGRGKLPYLEEIAGPFPRRAEDAALAYGMSYRAVSALLADVPDFLPTLTAFMRDRGDFEDAFFLTFGVTPYDFASRLYVSVHERYRAPGVILNAVPYWFAAAALLVAAFVARRARTRRRLREMEERETEGAPPAG
jgi:hypothetical protein